MDGLRGFKRRSIRAFTASAGLGALALTGCFDGETSPHKGPDTYVADPCVEVPEAARAESDSLVSLGNRELADELDFWFSRSDSWEEAKTGSTRPALKYYDQALAVAPGHCQALFGRAIASASLITEDPKLDAFVNKVESMDEGQGPGEAVYRKKAAFAGLFKTSPHQAAPVLIKLSASLDKMDRPTVKEVQELIETSILPRLDTTIASLEKVLDHSLFAIRFDIDGDTVEIDRGELGPGLAGLKVAKAWLTVVAGYHLDASQEGTYDWVRTAGEIRAKEYDHLTPDQIQALDHLTGLFKRGNAFTRMKPAWAERIRAIPELLLSAVADAQVGLESAIAEARSGDPQRYDTYKVGSGEGEDIDTADLRIVIDLLERSKKYLAGEVPVKYDKGGRTLDVNFSRLFHIDGAQSLLPEFRFYAYDKWNDTVASDTGWSTYLGYETGTELMTKAGVNPYRLEEYAFTGSFYVTDSVAYADPSDYMTLRPVGKKVILSNYSGGSRGLGNTTLLAFVEGDSANPCDYRFKRFAHVESNGATPMDLIAVPDTAEGSLTLSGCRVKDGAATYVSWIDPLIRGPIYFTDTAGNKTLELQDLETIDNPRQLKGKVVFKDPTFGGILPGMTNHAFWEHVDAVKKSPARTQRHCPEYGTGKCTLVLPANPGDLDYLQYVLLWMEEGF